MPNAKCTIFFAADFYAWTESFWTQVDRVNLATFLDPAADLATKRAGLLGKLARITEVRLSFSNPDRKSLVVPAGTYRDTGPPYTNVADTNSDEPNSAILLRYQDASGHRKVGFVAGYPDLLVTVRGGAINDVQATPLWLTNFNAWKTSLQANWGWKALQLTSDGGFFGSVINLVIDAAPPNRIGLRVIGPVNPIGLSSKVLLSGFSRNQAGQTINGTWQVQNIIASPPPTDAVTVVLNNSEGIDISTITRMGTLRSRTYLIYPVVTVDITGPGRRKRGVRSNRPLGRLKHRTAARA